MPLPTTGVKTDQFGNPYLEIDDFGTALVSLRSLAWVIDTIARYDPTHLDGLTPSGKVFTADFVGNLVTLTIAGNVRTSTVAKTTWMTGAGTSTALTNLRATFPSAQR